MKQILQNLATIDLLTFCKENKIDPSGTHVYKYPRRFEYALVRDETGRGIITVSFYKNSVPSHFIHN